MKKKCETDTSTEETKIYFLEISASIMSFQEWLVSYVLVGSLN